MKKSEVLNAWASILTGQKPTLSIEITRECPLRCPGCYAYEPEHLGPGGVNLRQLSDYKGDDLVRRILAIVDREKPIHLSLVGGDPLVRYRELEVLLPQLEQRGVHVQLVTAPSGRYQRHGTTFPSSAWSFPSTDCNLSMTSAANPLPTSASLNRSVKAL
jgi:organic radical activating enzyme